MRFDTIWLNARLATLDASLPGLGVVEHGALAATDGKIAFAGPMSALPTGWDARERVELDGRWITPGLIDCHTHIVHGGDRALEFEMRLAGKSYEEIARAGGGILSTVRATRAASEDELVASALPRIDRLLAEGVTGIEIKSGYGLDAESETKMLRAARRLGRERAVSVATSFLGAHALPPEAKGDRAAYIDCVCAMIPAVEGGRPRRRGRRFLRGHRVFSGRNRQGLCRSARRRLAGQTACRPTLQSAWRQARRRIQRALGRSSRTRRRGRHRRHGARRQRRGAAAGRFLCAARDASARRLDTLRKHKVPIALATDCNPGTSPITSLLLIMNMAATLFRLTVDEIVAGVTREAARALGRQDAVGTLEAGKTCDLAIWNIERPAELVYRIGFNPLHQRVWHGASS